MKTMRCSSVTGVSKVAKQLGIDPVIETLTLGHGEEADAERLKLAIISNVGFKPMT